jgi:hypothetical protein
MHLCIHASRNVSPRTQRHRPAMRGVAARHELCSQILKAQEQHRAGCYCRRVSCGRNVASKGTAFHVLYDDLKSRSESEYAYYARSSKIV